MTGAVTHIGQAVDGAVTIARHLPGQAARVFSSLTPAERARLLSAIRSRLPKSPLGAFQEDSLTKALPVIALGILALVAFNILRERG